jgi:hypothetical protein
VHGWTSFLRAPPLTVTRDRGLVVSTLAVSLGAHPLDIEEAGVQRLCRELRQLCHADQPAAHDHQRGRSRRRRTDDAAVRRPSAAVLMVPASDRSHWLREPRHRGAEAC